MAVRWVAASLLEMEGGFGWIMGYQQQWVLETRLNELAEQSGITKDELVASTMNRWSSHQTSKYDWENPGKLFACQIHPLYYLCK